MDRIISRRALSAWVLVLAACDPGGVGSIDSDGGPGAGNEDGGQTILFSCNLTVECPIGHTCVGGICVRNEQVLTSGGCFSNADCRGPGQSCDVLTGDCFPRIDAGPSNTEDLDAGPPSECFEGQSRTCGLSKVGGCRFGQEPCVDNHWSGQCVGAIYPVSQEACDDLDDDCDGRVDEDFDKVSSIQNCGGCGRNCSYDHAAAGCAGGSCAMGDCDSDWWDLDLLERSGCEYPCRFEGAEECDGEDDDCDGDVDEDFRGLTATCGIGACRHTVSICASGVPTACAPLATQTESCDGLDNDCDTQTDEGFVVACGFGVCRRTVNECVGGAYTACAPNSAASGAEACNLGDDDCDGATDEDFAGVVRTCGQGICAASTPACIAGVPQVCQQGTPQASEVCEPARLDENCNGSANEGCGCDGRTLGETTDCYTGPAPTRGVGACRAGIQTCVTVGPGQDWGACQSQVLPAAGESCNGADDDCDGTTDEGFGTLSCGTGQCARTVAACLAGVANTCTAGAPSQPEGDARPALCNGLDDDCDTLFDEGYSPISCGVGVCRRTKATCVSGVFDGACAPGSPTYAAEGASVPASCNALDDDCDGLTDDNFAVACGFGLCRRTVQTCANGSYAACTPNSGASRAEQCNALDDDCDGLTDEDFTDADRDGFTLCQNDCDDQNGTIYPGAVEGCNGRDDDCDGATDETFDADRDLYSTCNVDPALIDCNDANAAVHPGATEVCGNTLDEDCDGYAESCDCTRDNDGDGYKGGTGTRVCPDCNDGRADVNPGQREKCDGYDNDCNQNTVENCNVDQYCDWGTAADGCSENLICAVRSSDNRGVCVSLCNWSQNSGLLDGCAPNQSCTYIMLYSADMHACGVPLIVGAKTAGQPATLATECKSNRLYDDPVFGKYCTDFCADDTYCTPNDSVVTNRTFCRIIQTSAFADGATRQIYTATCLKVPSSYRPNGQLCSALATDSASECRNGDLACQNGRCAQPCCNDDKCPVGNHCTTAGANMYYGTVDPPGPNNSYDFVSTVPVCNANVAGNGGRRAGEACTANAQCLSEFCERNALSGDNVNGKCVELCCNHNSCAGTTTCESVRIQLPGVSQFGNPMRVDARACVHLPLDEPFLQMKAN